MYHDQALIPLKTLAFWEGVNVTLGLPIVRTSPDHGTALDIAGTGKADLRSMLAAIALAAEMADARADDTADPLPPLREVIAAHGLAAKKSLGQNFLLDLNLTRRIARAAGPLENTTVYEVGPGPGGLTRALLAEGAARVIAVERDERCLAALEGDRRSLSRPSRHRVRRRAEARRSDAVRGAERRAARARRLQPALQHRQRAAGQMADGRHMAALLAKPDPDVPARSGRAAGRRPAHQSLWPALGADAVAHAREDPVRRFARAPSRRRPR